MRVLVERVSIPAGSTIGFGMGTTDNGTVAVLFVGDHRPMRALGEAISESDEPIEVEVPTEAVLAASELKQ